MTKIMARDAFGCSQLYRAAAALSTATHPLGGTCAGAWFTKWNR